MGTKFKKLKKLPMRIACRMVHERGDDESTFGGGRAGPGEDVGRPN